jgi:hypothetical protein
MRIPLLTVALVITTTGAFATDTNTDKSKYDLFHPTPMDLLRPMNSEEADKIANPFTVDAGHIQIEATLVDYFYANRQGTIGPAFSYNLSQDAFLWHPVIKLGLLNNVDFEVEPTYHYVSTTQTGNSGLFPYSINRTRNDFGDVSLAVKWNLWGNDGGATALALNPYIAIPTQGERTVVGGLHIPFAWQLPWQQLVLKFSTTFAAVEDQSGTLYMGFENALALEKNLTEELMVFCNLSTSVTTDSSADWVGYAGFGAAYTFSKNFQAYAGMRFGFEGAYDYNPYAGVTLRF